MKIGLVSAILQEYNYEQMIDIVSEVGYECVEVACWPSGKSERRYAGVSHIDVDDTSEEYIKHVLNYAKDKNVEISSLAFYPNTLDSDLEKREFNINHLKKVITMSSLMGINMVTTFIGRDQFKNEEENLELFDKYWPEIISYAEEHKVKVAIENCPMLFGQDQWPGGQNLARNPKFWEYMFNKIPSDYFGLNYDPSHMIWQMMDPIKPIYDFKDKIFHIHFKDIKVFKEKLDRVGVMAYPLDFMEPKIPGLGDVNWSKFVSALTDIRYKGFACVEVEDRAFEDSLEEVINSLILSKRYLNQFVI